MVVSHVTLETGVQLSCAEQGDGTDGTLVLLPGPTDSWVSYGPVIEFLPPSIRTIAVSPRGHGDSSKPPSGYRVEDFAADIPPLLRTLRVERAVLAGHSGSCLVARRVTLDRPELVAGLVLEASPTSLREHRELREFTEGVVSVLEDPIDLDFARSFVADTSSDSLAPELLERLVLEVGKVPARVWRDMFFALLDYDDLAELDRIATPTVLIWGDADTVVPRHMQHGLVDRITGAELVVYPGVGHTPRWEATSRFAADVAAFVERVSAS